MSNPSPALGPLACGSYVDIYKDGSYLQKNPAWHAQEAPFKAKYILELLRRNSLQIQSVCDAGCGAGEVLRLLQLELSPGTEFTGFDISPQAYELSQTRANAKLRFELADITNRGGLSFDLLLVLDVIEHLEDYFSFLRAVRGVARYKVFHFPLDLSVQTMLRKDGLLKRRRLYAHLHFFTKETAFGALSDAGYRVLDYCYTPRSNELGSNLSSRILRLPRTALSAIHPDFAVRLLGGYSLMALAE